MQEPTEQTSQAEDDEQPKYVKSKKTKTKKSKYKVIKNFNKSKFFGFLKGITTLFIRRAKVVDATQGCGIPKKAIFLSTHGVKPLLGIIKNEMSMPKEVSFVTIGTHELCNPFFKRMRYGYAIHYHLRHGWGKIRSFFASFFVCSALGLLYKMARVIPSYRDGRTKHTLKQSLSALQQGHALLIYPEQLEHGYNNVFTEFLPGFVFIAEMHYKRTGEDIPICPCYFSYQHNKLIIGKPQSAIELLQEGKTRDDVAEFFRLKVNELYATHIQAIIQEKEAKFAKFNRA